MVDFQIKKLIGLVSAGGMVLKRMGSSLINVPFRALRTVFEISMTIVSLPYRLLKSFYRLIVNHNKCGHNCDKCMQTTSDTANGTSSEISTQVTLDPSQEQTHDGTGEGFTQEQTRDGSADGSTQEQYREDPFEETGSSSRQCVSDEIDAIKDIESIRHLPLEEINCVTGADYILYSQLVTERTFKLIHELGDVIKRLPSVDEIAERYIDDSNSNDKSVEETAERYIDDSNSDDESVEETADLQKQSNEFPKPAKRDPIQIGQTMNGNSPHLPPVTDNFRVEDQSKSSSNKLSNSKASAAGIAEAIRFLKRSQHEKMLNQEYNSAAKGIFRTGPAAKQTRNTINLHGNENVLGNFESAKNCNSYRSISEQTAKREEGNQINGYKIFNLSIDVMHNLVDAITQEIVLLKRRLAATNKKVEEVLKSSDTLFEELSKINDRFNRLITLSTKITDLQHELGADHKLLKEVEADRNEMTRKLKALERMIKEEEEYLDDASIESGYDELENRATSPSNHDDL